MLNFLVEISYLCHVIGVRMEVTPMIGARACMHGLAQCLPFWISTILILSRSND